MLNQIWKNKSQILEGLKNSIFKNKIVETIATSRQEICRDCVMYDVTGTGCLIPGTQPCCDKHLGGCGCSLSIKQRSLSSECPNGYWKAVITEEEENNL